MPSQKDKDDWVARVLQIDAGQHALPELTGAPKVPTPPPPPLEVQAQGIPEPPPELTGAPKIPTPPPQPLEVQAQGIPEPPPELTGAPKIPTPPPQPLEVQPQGIPEPPPELTGAPKTPAPQPEPLDVQAEKLPESPPVPQAPVKGKPKLKQPYPVPDQPLRRELPQSWDPSKIVMDELFHELLDVHSGNFDGGLATKLQGVNFAVVDKLAIGTAYVKAQVWDEKEDGPFKPERDNDHKEMALAMAPAAVCIVPSKDPKRMVYVNVDEYGGAGKEPNYDSINAVLLHEAHHASSSGFVNNPYFPDDTGLSWNLDECVTEYFTKKVWDSKYPDKADDYFQYTSYFSDKNARKGWYGDVGKKIADTLGETALASAYFGGDEKSLTAIAAHKDALRNLAKSVKK